jgi:hypothetical protein
MGRRRHFVSGGSLPAWLIRHSIREFDTAKRKHCLSPGLAKLARISLSRLLRDSIPLFLHELEVAAKPPIGRHRLPLDGKVL